MNFAFMQKIDCLVKKAIFGVFCLSSNRFASRVTARIELDAGVTQAVARDARRESVRGKTKCPKNGFFH